MQTCKLEGIYKSSKNKGMYDVCMQVCKSVDLQILKFQLCKYESMKIFMYKRIKVYTCAGMQISKCVGMPLCMNSSIHICKNRRMKHKKYASF